MIEIRKIKIDELDHTMKMVWKVFLKFEAPDYTEEGILEFKSCINDPKFISKLDMYGAFDDDKIIGMIATRDGSHIALFFVDEMYQGMGIGRELYDKICDENTFGYWTVNSSPYAKSIYEHLGFECLSDLQELNGIKFYSMKGYIKTNNKIKKIIKE